jgi:hypothetical protein
MIIIWCIISSGSRYDICLNDCLSDPTCISPASLFTKSNMGGVGEICKSSKSARPCFIEASCPLETMSAHVLLTLQGLYKRIFNRMWVIGSC